MKYLPLVWAGIWRKRSRAILLLLQIATAFALFGTLQGLSSGIRQVIAEAHPDRLFVASRVSATAAISTLPVSMVPKIESMSGVRRVTPQANLTGTWQQSNQTIPVTATNVDQYLQIYDEIRATAGAAEAMRERRTGAIAGAELLRKYGWKVGERIVLQTAMPRNDGTRDWTFDLVARYDIPDHPDNADSLIINFAYLNDARLIDHDRTNFLVVQADDPANAGSVGLAIDNTFINSDHETKTQSEADRLASQMQSTVDLDYIVRGIVGAVFFSLLLATGTLIMQSVRERESELAVLKTLGFSDRFVLVLILAESAVLSVSGALLGLGCAAIVLPRVRATDIDVTHMPTIVVLAGIGFAVLVALISASAPAMRGSRGQIAHALVKR